MIIIIIIRMRQTVKNKVTERSITKNKDQRVEKTLLKEIRFIGQCLQLLR